MAGPAVIPADTLAVLTFSMPGTNTRGKGQGGPITVRTPLRPATGTGAGPGPGIVFFDGSGFQGEQVQVEVGGVMAAAVIVNSDVEFRCQFPAHAPGVVDVRVWPGPVLVRDAFTYTP